MSTLADSGAVAGQRQRSQCPNPLAEGVAPTPSGGDRTKHASTFVTRACVRARRQRSTDGTSA